ncbi:MAG: hypothetical protein U1F65_10955 [Verrucomicrobiota bacterium]
MMDSKLNFRLRLALLTVLVGLLVVWTGTARADNTPGAYRQANRWLIVIETSRAMQPRSEAVAQLAGNLVLSGMNGQLRPGDTIGVWTFNASLRVGEFPLQTWKPEEAKSLAANLAAFVARQKFEGRSGRGQVFTTMNQVISNSEFITVVLLTSGNATFSGTPFDKAINTIQQQWLVRQEKAGQPFVTMLRAQGGHITDFEVGRPPLSLDFPPLPAELLVTNPIVVATPPKPLPPSPPPVAGSNLIVYGKKVVAAEDPTLERANQPEPLPVVEVKTNPPAPVIKAVTNPPVVEIPRQTNQAAVVVAKPQTNAPAEAPVKAASSTKGLAIFGAVAALAAVAFLWLVRKRSPSEPRVSLITRSLDREKK